MTFIINLKMLLSNKDVSQKDLAEGIGVSKSLVSQYLSDQKHPSAEIAKKIAGFFGISLDWLMSDDEAGKGGEVREPTEQNLAGPVQELVEIFTSLDKKEQKTVLDMVRALKREVVK